MDGWLMTTIEFESECDVTVLEIERKGKENFFGRSIQEIRAR
jgi:hypothetical protein